MKDPAPRKRRTRPSADARVADLVISRITSGRYPVGGQLPSSRELAAELGTNHSAVNQAYNDLARRGVVTTVWGKGTFVAAQPRPVADAREVEDALEGAFARGLEIGLAPSQLIELGRRSLDQVLRGHVPRVAVVECSEHDIAVCANAVERRTGLRTTGVLISEVFAHGDVVFKDCDAVAVTYFHVGELLQALPGVEDRMVTMDYRPSTDSVRRIIDLGPGASVITAASTGRGVVAYRGLAQLYGCSVVGAWSPDRPQAELIEFVRSGAHVLASATTAKAIEAMGIGVRPVVVNYSLDAAAVDDVAGQIEQVVVRQASRQQGLLGGLGAPRDDDGPGAAVGLDE